MKQLLFLILTCLTFQLVKAQTTQSLDNERLLQYHQAQQYAEAVKYLESLYKDSTDVKILRHLAYSNLMAGNLTAAQRDYLKLNAQLPEDAAVLLALGDINTRLNRKEKARAYFQKVLTIDSNNFNALKQLSAPEHGVQSDSKMNYLLKANQLNTADPEVSSWLSAAYFRRNLFEKAEEILLPALQADSDNVLLLSAKIPASMALKKYNDAIQTGKKLEQLQQSPSESLLFQMAQSYRAIKDYKTAAAYLQQAIKEGISTKMASYYGLLGDSYESMNKNKEAVEVYKRGLLFENNGSLYYNIAQVYENKLNDKKNAISYYTQYLNSIKDREKQKRHIAFIKNKIEELKR